MAYVYMLRCADGSYYVGSTRSLELRVEEHQRGVGGRYTACRRPVVLVWAFETDRVDEAYQLEKQIQNWSRAKRRALVEGRYTDLPHLSRCRRDARGSARSPGSTDPPGGRSQ